MTKITLYMTLHFSFPQPLSGVYHFLLFDVMETPDHKPDTLALFYKKIKQGLRHRGWIFPWKMAKSRDV